MRTTFQKASAPLLENIWIKKIDNFILKACVLVRQEELLLHDQQKTFAPPVIIPLFRANKAKRPIEKKKV